MGSEGSPRTHDEGSQLRALTGKPDLAGAEVCLSIDLGDEGRADSCFNAETIATRLACHLFGNSDGSFTAIGIVPDEVDTVEIGDAAIPIVDNVWTTQINQTAPD